MKTSELIAQLQKSITEVGDQEIRLWPDSGEDHEPIGGLCMDEECEGPTYICGVHTMEGFNA